MPSETEICFRRHFYNQTAGRLFEFVGVLQADDVGVVFETCGRRAFAVHIVAACLRRAVAGVVDVDVGVGGIDDVVFADMVFHAGGEPDAVAVGQAVHAVVGVADGRFVKSDAGAQLQRFADLIRTAEADFVGVASVGGDGGAVGFAVDDGFFFFKNQFRLIEAAVARPSYVAEQVGFIGHFVHTVYGQRLRRNDFNAGFFIRRVAERCEHIAIPQLFRHCVVCRPFGIAFERV